MQAEKKGRKRQPRCVLALIPMPPSQLYLKTSKKHIEIVLHQCFELKSLLENKNKKL